MSSTYAHYQQPSSLPADYAILSRLNSHNEPSISESDLDDEDSTRSTGKSIRRVSRRESFPAAGYYRPLKPTLGKYPTDGGDGARRLDNASFGLPSETTPLLNNPPFPRIEESIDHDPSSDDESKVSMFWEEMRILTKYSFPVFG
jgi:MATE family multidrug resistance protein